MRTAAGADSTRMTTPRFHQPPIRRRRQSLALIVALAALLTVASAPMAHALSGEQAVAALNAQRSASGIPGDIVHVPEWSRWCGLHNAYQKLNRTLTHEESPSAPGYTPEGARAGGSSVLSSGSWTTVNPWEHAPLHLHALLSPRLAELGVDESNGYVCATTNLGLTRPPPAVDTVYVYPGQGVRHRFEEAVAERPFTPGEKVGIPAGTVTGPYLYVSVVGPALHGFSQARVTAASLVGPDGPVEVRTVDNFTDGMQLYIPSGGEVIPLHPLRPGSTYTASVRLEVYGPLGGGAPHIVARTWSFMTLRRDPKTSIDANVGSDRYREGSDVLLDSLSGASATVRATRPATGEVRTFTVRRHERKDMGLPAGHWQLCVGQPATADYEGHASCLAELVDVPMPVADVVSLRPPKRTRSKIGIPIRTHAVLAGRRIEVTIIPLKVRCARTGRLTSRARERCRHTPQRARKLRRTIVATPIVRVSVARPTGLNAVSIRVRSKAFVAGDVTVRAANVEGHLHR